MLPIRSGFPDFGPDPDFLVKSGPEMVWFLPKWAVPPLWSGFPDFGPDPDFFGQSGPDLVRILLKSPDFS